MNNIGQLQPRRRVAAFTLIELIVVIAIIALLAALIIPVVGAVNRKKQIAVAQAQLKVIESAIEDYKTKLGFYPPDNPNTPWVNPLYFELMGTTNNGAGNPNPTLWVTMDGSAQISLNPPDSINAIFGITGFANTSTHAHSDDQGQAATSFINNLSPNEVGLYDPANPNIKILVCSVAWPLVQSPMITNNPTLNPWQYMSSHPTNGPGPYNLWVDIVFGHKTNRICNWSPNPIVL